MKSKLAQDPTDEMRIWRTRPRPREVSVCVRENLSLSDDVGYDMMARWREQFFGGAENPGFQGGEERKGFKRAGEPIKIECIAIHKKSNPHFYSTPLYLSTGNVDLYRVCNFLAP